MNQKDKDLYKEELKKSIEKQIAKRLKDIVKVGNDRLLALTINTQKEPTVAIINEDVLPDSTKELYNSLEKIRELDLKFDSIRKELYEYDDRKKADFSPELEKQVKEILDEAKRIYKEHENVVNSIIDNYFYSQDELEIDLFTLYIVEIAKFYSILVLLNMLYYGKEFDGN